MEQPNIAAIKAKQDACDRAIKSSEEFLSNQKREYEAQSARMLLAHKAHEEQMALEHQRILGMMRAENEKMLAEAAQMRAHFARTLASVPETSFEDVKLSQRRLYDEALEKRLRTPQIVF